MLNIAELFTFLLPTVGAAPKMGIMKKISILLGLLGVLISPAAQAVDGIYFGGELGHTSLGGAIGRSYTNAIGLAADVGFRVNPLIDLTMRAHYSSHGTGTTMNLLGTTATAEIHFLDWNDFEVSAGAGPGFYFFQQTTTESKFGLNFTLQADLLATSAFRVGLGWRGNWILGDAVSSGSFWFMGLRLGYYFELGGG